MKRPSEYMLMTDGITRHQYESELNKYIDHLEQKLSNTPTEEEIKLTESLLKIAKCPNCDGSSTIVNEVIRTGTKWVDDGYGNPIEEPYPLVDYEPKPCQWCYERTQLKLK